MQQVTLAQVGNWHANPTAFAAFRAIIRTVQETGWPKNYMIDLATDAAVLWRYQPTRFLYILCESGTDLIYGTTPSHVKKVETLRRLYGNEALFFVYDEDVLPERCANPYEPVLRQVTAQEAADFIYTMRYTVENGILEAR